MFTELYNEFLMLKKTASPEDLEKVSEEIIEKLSALQVGKMVNPALNSAAYAGDAKNAIKDSFEKLNRPIEKPPEKFKKPEEPEAVK